MRAKSSKQRCPALCLCDLNIKILNSDLTRICGVMCVFCQNVYIFELPVLFLTHDKFCSHY